MGICQIAKKYKSKCCGADVKLYCPDELKKTVAELVCVFVCLKCGRRCIVELKEK